MNVILGRPHFSYATSEYIKSGTMYRVASSHLSPDYIIIHPDDEPKLFSMASAEGIELHKLNRMPDESDNAGQ